MKFLSILICTLSALSVTESLAIDSQESSSSTQLIPRMPAKKGKSSSSSSSRRRPGASSGQSSSSGRHGRADSPAFLADLRSQPRWPSYRPDVRQNPSGSRNPRDGHSGLSLDHNQRRVYVDYGNGMPAHASSQRYHDAAERAAGYSRHQSFGLASRSEHDAHRRQALRSTTSSRGTVRDEAYPASFGYNGNRHPPTVWRVPQHESQAQGAQLRAATRYASNNGYRLQARETRAPTSSLYGRPVVGPNFHGYPHPVLRTSSSYRGGRSRDYETDSYDSYDSESSESSDSEDDRRKLVRRDAIDQINDAESDDDSSSPNNLKTYYQQMVDVYLDTLDNVTAIVLPIVDDMVAGSNNSSLVYEVALALMDLAEPSLGYKGPFLHGMHAFNGIEDGIFEEIINSTQKSPSNNTDISDSSSSEHYNATNLPPWFKANGTLFNGWNQMLAAHQFQIDLYQNAWQNATAQMNASGLTDTLDLLDQYLTTNDTSLYPAGWTEVAPEDSTNGGDAQFLIEILAQQYNSTK